MKITKFLFLLYIFSFNFILYNPFNIITDFFITKLLFSLLFISTLFNLKKIL